MNFHHSNNNNNNNNNSNNNTSIQSVIIDLIKQNKPRDNNNNTTCETCLIIVLGDKPRHFIETELRTLLIKQTASSNQVPNDDDDDLLTINDIRRLDKDIKILFLDKLQYLFMYLTYLEVNSGLNSNEFQYNNIIIFGLNQLMLHVFNSHLSIDDNNKKIEIIRLYQLILNSFYSLKNKFDTINKLLIIPYDDQEGKNNGDEDDYYMKVKNIELQINNYCKYINGQ